MPHRGAIRGQPPAIAMLPLDGAKASITVCHEKLSASRSRTDSVKPRMPVGRAWTTCRPSPEPPSISSRIVERAGDLKLAVGRQKSGATPLAPAPQNTGLDERDDGAGSPVQKRPRHLQARDSASDDGEIGAETTLKGGRDGVTASVPEDRRVLSSGARATSAGG